MKNVTHTCTCQLFSESFQNALGLYTPNANTLGSMLPKYKFQMTWFGFPYVALTQMCMGDTDAYVSKMTQLCIWVFDDLKSIIKYINLCTVVREPWSCTSVSKCVIERERETEMIYF